MAAVYEVAVVMEVHQYEEAVPLAEGAGLVLKPRQAVALRRPARPYRHKKVVSERSIK